MRIVPDNPSDPRHGYVEYQVDGVWGSLCGTTFTKNEANVVCKQLNFNGGVPYAPSLSSYLKVKNVYITIMHVIINIIVTKL
jgi:hypothetical protein